MSTWTSGALNRITIGGGISDVAVTDDGTLYIASEKQVIVYSADGVEQKAEIEFPAMVKRIAASAAKLVVEIEETDVRVLDLDSNKWSTIPPRSVPDGESVSAIEIVEKTLAISTSAGTILLFDMASQEGPILEDRVLCNQIVAGSWRVVSMTVARERIYAVLYDRNQSPPKGALVSIGRGGDNKWAGESIALFGEQQAQKLVVVGTIAYVQMTTGIIKVDLENGLSTPSEFRIGDNAYINAMSADDDKMYVVVRTDPMPTDNSMMLFSIDISNPDAMTTLSSLKIEYGIGNSDMLLAANDRVYKAGADEIRVFTAQNGMLNILGMRTIVIPVVTSAVQWDEDEVLVGRQGGVCRVSVSGNARGWCSATNRGAEKLLRVKDYLFAIDGANGIWSARVDGADVVLLHHIEAESPNFRYVDATVSSSGITSLLDANQPRGAKTHFRLEQWVIDGTGSLNKSGANDIETPDCGPAQVRIASSGEWLGLLCGDELIEYSLRDNDVARLGSVTLASRGTDLDVDAEGIVVIGTSAGLVLYNKVLRQVSTVKPPTGAPSAGVLAVKMTKDGIFAVHGTVTGPRSLVRYFLEHDGYETEEILHYNRAEGRPQQIRIVVMGDGIVLVTGSRVAIYLRPSASGRRRLSLPFVLR
ncbi:MAG: hypothetical protein ABI604_13980 [Nitrospirota bacterium]